MAEPKTEVDRRFDRHEEAIMTLAKQLFDSFKVEEIEKILRGEKSEKTEDISDSS